MWILAALLAGAPAHAEAPATPASAQTDATALVKRIQDRYRDVDTLQASFVQVTKSQLYGDEEQKGTVVLQRPSRMRWRFEGDGKQFVTDGTTMWIYNPADKQVIRYDDFGAQASAADSLLQSLHKVGELFEVKVLAAQAGHRLELVPKQEDAKTSVKNVVLQLDPELVVQQVVITDPFDSVTELSFSDVVLGAKVADDTFRFEVPEGVEVIDAGGAG